VLNAGLIAPAIAVLHAALLKEKAECPVPSKPFRPAPLANRSVGARRVARLAKVGREEPIVGLLIHGVSVAGIAARERARPETRKRHRNRLKRLNPRGNGMAPGSLDPQDLVREGSNQCRHRECKRSDPAMKGAAVTLDRRVASLLAMTVPVMTTVSTARNFLQLPSCRIWRLSA